MGKLNFKYKAILVEQPNTDKKVVLFSAPVCQIESWAGIPQKKKFGESETEGFQRTEDAKRVRSLQEFYSNSENVIQNPLICAKRTLVNSHIEFIPDQDGASGYVVIDFDDPSKMSLLDLIRLLRENIENRVPALKGRQPSPSKVKALRNLAIENGIEFEDIEQEQDELEDIGDVLFEESHLADFWDDLKTREVLLEELKGDVDEFIHFSKESLMQYLLPISLVDGQHRLKGALEALESKLSSPDVISEINGKLDLGEPLEVIEHELRSKYSRNLPISLMLCDDPGEQVFQFVIINQKATPIGKPLLGTIISTSLSKNEMDGLVERLRSSGIELSDSQAVTWAAKHPESPFYNLVDRGVNSSSGTLQWSVMGQLVSIIRHLKGGVLFGNKVDNAAKWRAKCLNDSPIVCKFKELNFETEYDYWSSLDGPWKDFFIEFWSAVRDRFSNVDDEETNNFWGNPKTSNLFNKISLTILISDFFAYMHDAKKIISNKDDIKVFMDEWLEDVSGDYFNRDWKLSGVKKDSTGIKNQWSYLWQEYRRGGGNMPKSSEYKKLRG